MSNSSIWPIDRTLSGATTPGQSRPRSDGIERVFRIFQRLECLESYPGQSLEEDTYTSAVGVFYIHSSISNNSF